MTLWAKESTLCLADEAKSVCICGAETCFTCGMTWRACSCIQPNYNAVTDALGRAMQAQSSYRVQLGLIPQLEEQNRPLDESRIR